jgi:hypothetical protein
MSLTGRVFIGMCRRWPLGFDSDVGVKLRKAILMVLRKAILVVLRKGMVEVLRPLARR